MKKFCFPAWIIYIVVAGTALGLLYGVHYTGIQKGENSYACAPDVEWASWYMKCYEASFRSGVMCPCNRGFGELGQCTAILDNNVFTQEEKRMKVQELFGKEWASAYVPNAMQLKETCDKAGLCPAGKCVAWDGACMERMEKIGYSRENDVMNQCCVSVIPE